MPNDRQRNALRQTARQAMGRVSERVHFLLMRDQGMTPQQIANLMDYELRTVQRWLSRYDRDGIAGLNDQPRSGRPVLEAHVGDIVETQAGQPPTVYGYLQTIWTVALLTLHVCTRFRVAVKASTLRRALHTVRFSWHRPKPTPARKVDPLRAARQAHLSAILASSPDANLIAADEYALGLDPLPC